MPYIYVEELDKGMEECDVIEQKLYDELFDKMTSVSGELESVTAERDGLVAERDGLTAELQSAKTKFADAFLTTPQRIKSDQTEEMKAEERPRTFDDLFSERSK